MVESELENHTAQLSRFKLHLGSVKEDIQHMEGQLHTNIMALKKTLVMWGSEVGLRPLTRGSTGSKG